MTSRWILALACVASLTSYPGVCQQASPLVSDLSFRVALERRLYKPDEDVKLTLLIANRSHKTFLLHRSVSPTWNVTLEIKDANGTPVGYDGPGTASTVRVGTAPSDTVPLEPDYLYGRYAHIKLSRRFPPGKYTVCAIYHVLDIEATGKNKGRPRWKGSVVADPAVLVVASAVPEP